MGNTNQHLRPHLHISPHLVTNPLHLFTTSLLSPINPQIPTILHPHINLHPSISPHPSIHPLQPINQLPQQKNILPNMNTNQFTGNTLETENFTKKKKMTPWQMNDLASQKN